MTATTAAARSPDVGGGGAWRRTVPRGDVSPVWGIISGSGRGGRMIRQASGCEQIGDSRRGRRVRLGLQCATAESGDLLACGDHLGGVVSLAGGEVAQEVQRSADDVFASSAWSARLCAIPT